MSKIEGEMSKANGANRRGARLGGLGLSVLGHQKMTGLRAAIYLRVSSEEQVAGYSLDAQERAARAYCAELGWPIVGEYRDEGKSARTDDLSKRPEFARMLADVEAGLI